MIGYMKPHRADMTSEDKKTFRAYYCGLCHTLKYNNGLLSPPFMSYETICFRILADSLMGTDLPEFSGACSYSPMLYVKYKDYRSEDFENTASASLMLVQAELEDDQQDEKTFIKKLILSILKKQTGKMNESILSMLTNLSEAEKSGTDYIYLLDICGNLACEIMKPLWNNLPGSKSETIKEVIYEIARWEYLLDAFDDYEKDQKKGQFNLLYHINDKKIAYRLMNACLGRITELIGETDFQINRNLIEYLFQTNLSQIQKKVLSRRGFEDEY